MKPKGLIRRILVGVILMLSGVFGGLTNLSAALVPVKTLPENPFKQRTAVGLEFDREVKVSPRSSCIVYINRVGTWEFYTKGRLKLDENDPTDKRVIVAFTENGVESDEFSLWAGISYRFVVATNSIMEKQDISNYIDDYEWEYRHSLPRAEFNLEGEEKEYIVPEDLIFTWRGKENAVTRHISRDPKIELAVSSPYGLPYVGGMRFLPLRPLLVDSINHIYQYRGESENKENPDTIFLKKDVRYYVIPYDLYSINNPALYTEDSEANFLTGATPEESGKFPKIEPASISVEFLNNGTLSSVTLTYDTPIHTHLHSIGGFQAYLNGQPYTKLDSYFFDNNLELVNLNAPNFRFNPEDELEIDILTGMIGPAQGPLYLNPFERLRIPHPSGVGDIAEDAAERELPVFDLYGRKVDCQIPGNIYIRGGKKFVAR